MSDAFPSPSCGRTTPRWSTAGGGQPDVTLSTAGLFDESGARVKVGPPLFWRGPIAGSVFTRSFSPALKPQVFVDSMLKPSDVSALEQFSPPALESTDP